MLESLTIAAAIELAKQSIPSTIVGNIGDQAYATWHQAMHDLSTKPRPEFLAYLRALMPFTLALAGDEVQDVAQGIFRVIQEVCEWWP